MTSCVRSPLTRWTFSMRPPPFVSMTPCSNISKYRRGLWFPMPTAFRSRILQDVQLEDFGFEAERIDAQKMVDDMQSPLESSPGKIAKIVTEELR